ncbi:MAG: nitrogenase component 1 [Nibricoccus sp.]
MSCASCKPSAGPEIEGKEEFPGPTTNACKLCTPLGACLAYKGIAGTVPFLHGSQGCATYIRRYLISHFREPMDIAASNFAEHSAVFGGRDVLHTGLANVTRQYKPALIGVATTCLSEAIGENMPQLLHEYRGKTTTSPETKLVHVSTPSFKGTHVDGFHKAVCSIVETLASATSEAKNGPVALMPGFVSAEDLRHLKEIFSAFGVPVTLVPDYSKTMDGGSWASYERIPSGGTTVEAIQALGSAKAAIECGRIQAGEERTAGTHLLKKFSVPLHRLGLPIGLRETDRLCETVGYIAGREIPRELELARGRLIDAMVDGHKYVFGQRAIVYGEEDLVMGLTSFLTEIGVVPVLCASGGRSRRFAATLRAAVPDLPQETVVREGADFASIAAEAETLKPDLLIGNSKGYGLARRLKVPLVRCGFPIHDRLGGHRVLHVGYRGALSLYDTIVNALLERKQETSTVGYAYL